MKLVSENFGGNTHDAVASINEMHLAEHVLQIETSNSGMGSLVVLRVPDDFTMDRWFYDHSTEEEQQKIVAMECRRRQWCGEVV